MASSQNTLVYLLIAVLGFCLVSCAGNSKDTAFTEEIVGGVTVRTYLSPESPEIDPYTVIPATVIGEDQSENTYLLAGAGLLGISRSGLLVVLDSRSSRFHLFLKDGSHRGSFGRSGQGPGEFARMSRFLFEGETIHVFDRSTRRRTILDLSGTMLSLSRYPDEFSYRVAHPVAFIGPSENRLYLCELKLRSSLTNTFTFQIALRDTALALISIPIDSVYSPGIVKIGVDSRHFPFIHEWPASAVASDLPVTWSWGREFQIEFLDLIDQIHRIVRIPHEALPVTAEHREDYLRRYYEGSGQVEEARRKLPWPSHFPHLESMKWDATGRLWVQEYRDPLDEEAPWIYQVFDRHGAWLFRQELPVHIGDIYEDGMYVSEVDDVIGPVIKFYQFEKR